MKRILEIGNENIVNLFGLFKGFWMEWGEYDRFKIFFYLLVIEIVIVELEKYLGVIFLEDYK